MRNRKSVLICFTGIDGSGKSTQAKNLVRNLSLKNFKAKYVYARFNPILLKPILIIGDFLVFRNKNIGNDYKKRSQTRKGLIKRYLLLSKFFYKFMLFDYQLQLIFKIKIPLFLNKNIICDRYIYDTIVTDIAVDLGYSEIKISNIIDRCMENLPTPDIIFFLNLPENVAYSRKDDVPSIKYLQDRRKHYLAVVNKYEMTKINGEDKIEDIEQRILDITLSKLRQTK